MWLACLLLPDHGEHMTLNDKILGGVLIVLLVAGLFSYMFVPEVLSYLREKKTLETGVKATAVVVEMIDTGNRFNKNPQVRLKIEVRPEHQTPFHAEITMIISVVELNRFQPGSVLTVKYDEKDHSKVALVHGVKQ
jgi:hypothetical protein